MIREKVVKLFFLVLPLFIIIYCTSSFLKSFDAFQTVNFETSRYERLMNKVDSQRNRLMHLYDLKLKKELNNQMKRGIIKDKK